MNNARISPNLPTQSALLSRIASDARLCAIRADARGDTAMAAECRKLAIDSERLAKLAKLGKVVAK